MEDFIDYSGHRIVSSEFTSEKIKKSPISYSLKGD